ncbi:MAG: 50S ribosomal protein L23 [bacterium]
MRDPYEVLVQPLLTEKGMLLSQREEPQYTFKVAIASNKMEIKKAVEAAFKVKVKKVATIRMKGKFKRVRQALGKRSDWKKAIVTLKKGYTIELL